MINRISKSRDILTNRFSFHLAAERKLARLCGIIMLGLILTLAGCGGGSKDAPSDNNGGNTAGSESLSAFSTTLYPVLTNHCSDCHASQGPAGTPDFAHEDVNVAFNVVESNTLANLGNPSNSRLAQKLTQEMHKCGTSCTAWADEIIAAVQNWADMVAASGGGGTASNAITSSTLMLADSAQNAGGGRIEDAVIAKYEFKTGSGQTAFDTSGVAPALDLTLSKDVAWIPGQGIEMTDPNGAGITKAVGSAADSSKLFNLIAGPNGSKQYTIEAWIFNASTALTGPARIVSYSADATNRNFHMGQQVDYYNFRNRSDLTGNNGSSPALETDHNAADLKKELQHVVMTFDTVNGRNIYINGKKIAYNGVTSDPAVPADISNWNPNYQLVLGNEVPDSVRRQWLGKIYYVAIHDRALSDAEILHNTLVGIGQTYELRFDVSDLVDPSGSSSSEISLQVSELDDFSYLFSIPTMITDFPLPNIPVKNIRIAVNGNIPAAAQAFRTLDTTVTSSPAELSRLGAVIPKDLGPDNDRFTLVFETLGSNSNIVVEPNPQPTVDLSVNPPSPEHGLRTFEQINNTMATLTGVDKSVTSDTYDNLRQQLPSTPNLNSFVSAQQVGVTKLSLEYCDAMVENGTLRTNFFGNTFEFNSAVTTAFSSQAKRDIIINNLVNKLIGSSLNSQPSLADLQPDLNQLLNDLTSGCNVASDCDATRTRAIVKGACAAVLSSAAVLID